MIELPSSEHLEQSSSPAAWAGLTFYGGTEATSSDSLPLAQHQSRLSQVTVGGRVRIIQLLLSSKDPNLSKHGCVPGAELEVISSTVRGSVVIALNNQHLGLGALLAQRILVEPL